MGYCYVPQALAATRAFLDTPREHLACAVHRTIPKTTPCAPKVELVEKMQGQLAEINQDLAHLSARVEKSNDTAKAEAKPKLQAIRDQAAKLIHQLDEAKNAAESTWDDVKAGAKRFYDDLKGGSQQARQCVSDRIAL